MKRLLLTSSLAFAFAGCISIYGDISDLEDQVTVHESETPDGMTSNQYAVGFGFGGNVGDGVDFITVGNSPGGIGLLSFDASGTFRSEGQPTPGDVTLDTRPPITTINDAALASSIFVGMRGGQSGGLIAHFSPNGLSSTIGGTSIPYGPIGIATGSTGNTEAATADMLAVGEGQMTLVGDFLGTPATVTCSLPNVANLAVANFNGAGDDEVAVIEGTSFGILTPDEVAVEGNACPARVGVVELDPTGGEGFAENIVVGDFDGNSSPDVAISFHTSDRVFVVMNPDAAAVPTVETITGESGSNFGTSIAAGDLDGDGSDELIVGASNGTADNDGDSVAQAGFVSIQSRSGGSFSEAGVIIRAEPESGDIFGRAVGVVTFTGGRNLVVTASNGKVFVNFRDPLGGEDPRNR